ncbi:RimK/LysX family protein [Spirosoma sp. RP8]|uniref:RimK/LysX family protein n=1 Tax=Spirosoma liriopis TaxID=2937440 RepID=A0ABT0HL99_9BACT|nr:RimK/LysX family protein [Spirosoma liriopis]MCK8492365.1 RimK/LysX family protein [Spirosoma liriopis]
MKAGVTRPKQVIGMTDLVDFPDLGLFDVQAKVDTGAYTSSLHCKDVCLVRSGNKVQLSFELIDKTGDETIRYYSDEFSQRMIRNSFGVAEKRYVIKTRITLFGRSIRAEFTLADREQLKNPILLGRKLLRNRFVVDVSVKNLSYEAKATPRQKAMKKVSDLQK